MAERPLSDHIWDSSGQITSTGSANAYVIAIAEQLSGYYQGMPPIRFKANFTNTGSATANLVTQNAPAGLGAVTLKKSSGASNLVAGNIVSGGMYTLIYDGTNFQVQEWNGGALGDYIDLPEIAAPASPAANVARVFALDDGGITTVALKDAAGNTRSLSHFKQAGTGAAVRSQVSKLGDIVSAMDFSGIDPTGANDSAAAFQAAIDAVAAIGTRGTLHIPATGSGGDYAIDTALIWKPNVSIVCDPGVRIFAGASMDALLLTGLGTTNRLRNVFLQGGRWDGNFLAQRGIWVKDGNGVHMTDFLIRQVGAFVDGVTETESSYIRIGDPGQFMSCYEVVIDNFWTGRADDAASPSLAPANNYGIFSSDGASDCHVSNGVISGVKNGMADEMAHWKVNRVHVWNFQAGHGPLINAFYDAIGGVIFTNCQVDCATFEVPFRIGSSSGHPSALIGNQIHCTEGTDNTGHAIEVDSGTQLSAAGNTVTCHASHRFAADYSGTLTDVQFVGNQTKNVVSPIGNGVRINGPLRNRGTAPIGYDTGAGGSVTQATSKSTGVTINKPCGKIIMNGANLVAGTTVGFTVTNSEVTENDVPHVVISGVGTADAYECGVDDVSTGSFRVWIRNRTGGDLNQAVELNFILFNGVTT